MVPEWIKELVEKLNQDELLISAGDAAPYNSHIAEKEESTSVSSSGIVALGPDAVKDMSEQIRMRALSAPKDQPLPNRNTEYISCGISEDLFYTVVRTDSDEGNGMSWIITLVFSKIDGEWKLLHRQSTKIRA